MPVSPRTVERIKNLSVSSVLEADGVFLKKVGREYVTHCLWHKDRNPSLTISDDKGFVFCHVCQHHDDAIGFIQQRHGISFRDACERICSAVNIQLELDEADNAFIAEQRKAVQNELEKTLSLQQQYRNALKRFPEAIDFIKSRRILPETSRFFELGYDETERRITIPIKSHLNKLVGFSCRTIVDGVKPKYKNTENNLLFNKSSLLFNEDKASDSIRELDECVFVEGHFDVISLWQAGVKNVVALQGTATPSEDVLKRLFRKTRRFTLCMDADQGGKVAIGKFLHAVQPYTLAGELEVKIASLPDGMDPDEYIKTGNDIKSVIAGSLSWLDWILDDWLNELDFNDKLKIQKVEASIVELFSKIQSSALRAHYFDKASIRLAQNKQSLAAQIVKGFNEHAVKTSGKSFWRKPDFLTTRKIVEKRMLRVYIHKPEYRWVVKPLMEKLHYANMRWLWTRIQELEQMGVSDDIAHALMAVLSVAEPHYMQQLRSIVVPTIVVHDNESSLAHIEDVMIRPIEEDQAI